MKRQQTLVLALLLVFALILSACGTTPTATTPVSTTTAPTTAAQTTEPTPAPKLDPVTIKWYVPSGATAAVTANGMAAVIAKMDSITEPTINAKVDLQLVDFGNFETKMSTIIASGETFDLCFTANWFNSVINNVAKGAFAPLDELLSKSAPNLMKATPPYAWNSVKFGGKVYAMHCRQNWNMSEGIYVRKDLADKYGFKPALITPMSDLEDLYAKMRAGESKDFYPTYVDANFRWPYYLITNGFEEVAGRNMPAAFQLNGSGYKLVNQFATPEFKAYCEMMKLWNEKGYIRSDSATYSLTADNYTNDLKAGKIGSNQLGFVAPHVKAMAESGWDNKYEAVQVQTGGDWAINSIIQSSLTAVSITSKNPERAVMYYDLVVAKPELYNTILWGVEGVNFTKSSENQIKLIADTGYGNGSQVVPDWACGHQFNGWVLDTQSADIWQQVQAWSEKAKPSPILGFVFSPENVKTELANCSAVVTEQLRLLDTGSIDVATGLAKLLASLETAGSAKILAEAQSQLDVWTAANKK